MGVGLTAVAEEDGQLLLDTENGEEIRHVQSQVAIVLGNRTPEQPGTLYITTKRLIWLNDENKQHGYGVDFLSISLHAVSRDPEAYSLPCIYAQNKFEGIIPVNISLPALTHLDLSDNNFEGSVLESIARMANLQHLIPPCNNFGGQIPISLAQLSSLNFLDLGLNRLSGGLPSNVGDLSNFKQLFCIFQTCSV